jgi:hypothetical protein
MIFILTLYYSYYLIPPRPPSFISCLSRIYIFLHPLGSGDKKSTVLSLMVRGWVLGGIEKKPVGRVGWEKVGGIRWWPSFIKTHITGLLSKNLAIGRILFEKIPPSFAKGRGLGG